MLLMVNHCMLMMMEDCIVKDKNLGGTEKLESSHKSYGFNATKFLVPPRKLGGKK